VAQRQTSDGSSPTGTRRAGAGTRRAGAGACPGPERPAGPVDLGTPLAEVLTPKAARDLRTALGFTTVGELLDHLPRRYADQSGVSDLGRLEPGEEVVVRATVTSMQKRAFGSRPPMLTLTLSDDVGRLRVVFFNQAYLASKLPAGTVGIFGGKLEEYKGVPQLTNPHVSIPGEPGRDAVSEELLTAPLLPVYPTSGKLTSWSIAVAVRTVLPLLGPVPDPLPADLRARHRLAGKARAYALIHRPASYADITRARTRFKWDEAMVLQVALAQRRREAMAVATTARAGRPDGLVAAFDAALPFPLTAGQREVGETVAGELARSYPMHRLLQGEVGSGKTVVALRAMLRAVDSGGQAALLAPTETLAAQHLRTVLELLGPLGRAGELGSAPGATAVRLLTGSMGTRARRQVLAEIATGKVGLVIGTHALLSENVLFDDLALVVVDEQHRFGVEQRDALRARGRRPPHLLVMTATPIPRTVAMTVFGDLEVSTLTELPAGRSPITSHVVPAGLAAWNDRMWGLAREQVAAGHQVYVVCPRIDADEDPAAMDDAGGSDGAYPADGAEDVTGAAVPGAAVAASGGGGPAGPAAVLETLERLRGGELSGGPRVEALHGRLPAETRDAVMVAFAAGEIDVLVATTVIEVGVNVPNATVMIVLDADRFGVSQLHQLRGRVGRGSAPGWALLHTRANQDTPAFARLTAVASTLDGAELARVDLAARREGDVLGVAQSGGRRSLRLLALLTDEELITDARAEATALVAADPDLAEVPELAAALAQTLDERSAAYLEKG